MIQSLFEKKKKSSLAFSQSIKMKLLYNPGIAFLGIYSNKWKMDTQILVHPDSRQHYLHTQKVETTQMPINTNEWTERGICIEWSITHPRREGITDTCYSLTEPQNMMLSEKNQSPKVINSMMLFTWKFQNRQICIELESRGAIANCLDTGVLGLDYLMSFLLRWRNNCKLF